MSVTSQMETLCQRLAKALIPLMVPIIPSALVSALLDGLIGLLTEEQNSNDILNKLVGSYYEGGMDYLTDAKFSQQVEMRDEYIKQALDRFVTASNVEADLRKAKSQFLVGTCHDLQNEKNLAKIWYERAYTSASQLATQLQQQSGLTIREAAPGIGLGLLGLLIPGGALITVVGGTMAIAKTKKHNNQKKMHEQQLQELAYFMNSLSQVILAYRSIPTIN